MSQKDIIRKADGSVIVKGNEAKTFLQMIDAPTYMDIPDKQLGAFCRMTASLIEKEWDNKDDKEKMNAPYMTGALILMGSVMQKTNATSLKLSSKLTRNGKSFGKILVTIKFTAISNPKGGANE